MVLLTDPSSNVTTWGYDNLNRAVGETNQLNFTRTFAYNAAGDLTSKVDRNGRKTTYEYDALHRQTAEKWRDGSDNVIRTISSTFDNSLDMTGVSDPAAAYTYVYDNLGRVTQQTQEIAGLTPDIILAQQFDAASNRTKLAATIGENLDFANDYVYDNLDRLTRVTQDAQPGGEMGMPPYANAVAPKRVDFTYFADGQFNTITRYADLTTNERVAVQKHDYDGIGRLDRLVHSTDASALPSGTGFGTNVLGGYEYTYDAASRITSINSSTDGTSNFSYDVTDQLTGNSNPSESYSYDSNGNRNMTGYTTGSNNQITSDGTYNYTYDNEGNLSRRTTIVGGSYEDYAWDYRNRLSSVTFKTSGGTVTQVVEYTYDAFNRLVARSHDPDGPGASPAALSYFAYDGNQIVLQFNGSQDTNLDHRYLWGPIVDQLLADEDVSSLTSPGTMLWPFGDHLGTLRDLATYNAATNVTTVANHRIFNAFGKLVSETNSAIDEIFGETGRLYDEVTGANYHHHRWLRDGRWLSPDPIEFLGGDPNLYRVVGNSPMKFIDPSGLTGIGTDNHVYPLYLGGGSDGVGYPYRTPDEHKKFHRSLSSLLKKAQRWGWLARFSPRFTQLASLANRLFQQAVSEQGYPKSKAGQEAWKKLTAAQRKAVLTKAMRASLHFRRSPIIVAN